MSRKKERRITEKDYYRMKGIKPEDAEKDDYVPMIFKPRPAAIPMFLAVVVWLWRFFGGPELEPSFDWTFGIILFIGLLQMAILECRKERFPQWGFGMIYLLTAILVERCFWGVLIFSAWMFFALSVIPATELWKKGKKTQALLVGVLIFILSGSGFIVSGGVCMYSGIQAILFPYTAKSVEKIVFRQNGRSLQIDSPEEIARIVEAWDMYFFATGRARGGPPPYSLEGRPQWNCTIYRKDGGKQEFLLALGLRRQSQSFYVKITDPPEWFNPFGMARNFQCPKLYPVLQPILEQNPYHSQPRSQEISADPAAPLPGVKMAASSYQEEQVPMVNHKLVGREVLISFSPEDLEYQAGCEKEYKGKITELGQYTLTAHGKRHSGFYLDVDLLEALQFKGMRIVKIKGQARYAGEGLHTFMENGWLTCNMTSPRSQWNGARGQIKLKAFRRTSHMHSSATGGE